MPQTPSATGLHGSDSPRELLAAPSNSGALGADIVATIGLATRVVTWYAGCYSHDTHKENEKAVTFAVISAGVAAEGAAEQAALLHLRQVAMTVARLAMCKELSQKAAVRLIQ